MRAASRVQHEQRLVFGDPPGRMIERIGVVVELTGLEAAQSVPAMELTVQYYAIALTPPTPACPGAGLIASRDRGLDAEEICRQDDLGAGC